MTTDNVTGMTKTITEYGIGIVAVAILFVLVIVMVGVLIKLLIDNNVNHRKEMIPVLKALTDSIDTLSDTQLVFKDLLVERINTIGHQGISTHSLLETHVRDCSRLEGTLNNLQPSILKTEERTKVCVERSRKGPSL